MSEITILPTAPITLQMTEGNSRPIIIGGGDPIVLQVVESLVAGTVIYPALTALTDLTDVILTSPASQQMLVFQSITNKWENQANVPNHVGRHYMGGGDPSYIDASQIVTGVISSTYLGSHKTTHQDGGTDELALDGSQITTGSVVAARLGAHASTHNDGGADEIAIDASQITTGTIAAARLPDPTIDYVSTINTLDVAMTTANQVYTVASISLPAGTWMINGQTVLMQGASAGAAAMTMFLYNFTTPAYIASTSAHKASVSSTSQGLNCSVVVVLSVPTTIHMKAVSSIAAFTARYLSTTGNYDGASSLYAVRIAP